MKRNLALLAAAAVAAAFVVPMFASDPTLDRIAQALVLAGPAAAAAIASAAGRPLLSAAALAALAGYVSGALALRGVPVPLSVLTGTAAGAATGAGTAVLLQRLDAPAFVLATLLMTIAGGALVQALPGITGAQAGLGPLPGVSVPLSAQRTAVFTPLGDFHVLLAIATLGTAAAVALLHGRVGREWRAVGSDRVRAATTHVNPLLAEVSVLAIAGALAALSGAVGAHVARVATGQGFALDVAALPLLAALAAAREPLAAAIVAVATGVLGTVLLPAAGWRGPPDAMSLAIGILALATLLTLLPSPARRGAEPAYAIDRARPWPLDSLRLEGGALELAPMQVRAPNNDVLLDAPQVTVAAGSVVGIVGPNGSGKTTLLGEIERLWRRGRLHIETNSGRAAVVALLPQEGGGFATCSVLETLLLAARHRNARDALSVADTWLQRLNLQAHAHALCAELSAAQRRTLDLARAVLAEPQVLLCDEPLAGLDDDQRAACVALLKAASNAGLTVVVAEHDREAVSDIASSVVELQRADTHLVPAVSASQVTR